MLSSPGLGKNNHLLICEIIPFSVYIFMYVYVKIPISVRTKIEHLIIDKKKNLVPQSCIMMIG